MTTTFDARAYGRKHMLHLHGKTEADLQPKKPKAEVEAERLGRLPKSIAEAGGDVRAFAAADMERLVARESGKSPSNPGRANMEAQLRQMGLTPVR